nr:hypothetical protein HmN_000181400 [Hymenolepis microstoma]
MLVWSNAVVDRFVGVFDGGGGRMMEMIVDVVGVK